MNSCSFLTRSGTIVVLALLVVGLAGCAAVPVNYAPGSVLSASGSTSVSEFRYRPAENGVVTPNQIKNTAVVKITIDRDVNLFFRDAVFSELRFVGVKIDNQARVLSGEIVEFLIDDLGFSIDWTLKVKYRVIAEGAPSPVYESEKVTKRKTAKALNFPGALNETIKLNIEEVIRDPAFVDAIR